MTALSHSFWGKIPQIIWWYIFFCSSQVLLLLKLFSLLTIVCLWLWQPSNPQTIQNPSYVDAATFCFKQLRQKMHSHQIVNLAPIWLPELFCLCQLARPMTHEFSCWSAIWIQNGDSFRKKVSCSSFRQCVGNSW